MSTATVTRRIAQASAIIMVSVLAGRILGFFREWTVAHQIGSNAVTDAYFATFTLPDFLNYLVAGGSLSITFIPVFTQFVVENREDEGWHVLSTVICAMSPVLGAGCGCGNLGASVGASHFAMLRRGGKGPRHLSNAPHDVRANLLLSREHLERHAIRQGPVCDALTVGSWL